VSLDYQLPIANAILTTENMAQADRPPDRTRGATRPRSRIEMANLLEDIG
jgi:6,7-dimethyl-8-ribityllumazine synthase